MVKPNKKELKRMLSECLRNLNNFTINDELKVLIIQFRTKEQEYIADFHVNEDALLGDKE